MGKIDPDLESTDPDIRRAAEKRAAAAAAERGDTPVVADEPTQPKAAKARRQTTRG